MVEKLLCPDCKQACTGIARLATHVRGAHLKQVSPRDRRTWLESHGASRELRDRLRDLIAEIEPGSDDDEELISAKAREGKQCGFGLDEYLDRSALLCREERQFTHLLAAALKSGLPVLARQLELTGQILEVIYEPALMRDYWFFNRRELTRRFKIFLSNLPQLNGHEIPKPALSGTEEKMGKHPNRWATPHALARWMMNCKPDLAVVERSKDGVTLHFVECKYWSREDVYSTKDSEFSLSQTEVQELVLRFLCDKLLTYGGPFVTAGRVLKVQFKSKHLRNRPPKGWTLIDLT